MLLTLVLSGTIYAGLVWYPQRAAGDLMRPLSEGFSGSASAVAATVAAFPAEPGLESLAAAGEVLSAAEAARGTLAAAQLDLEERTRVAIPVISGRDPLRLANTTRTRIEELYPEALQLIGDLEAAARYLTQLTPLLPTLDNLEAALGGPIGRGGLERILGGARPIADQLLADVRTLAPPDELATSQASLLAIARGIKGSIEELERVGGAGGSPVLRALIEDVRAQIESFRQAAAGAAAQARVGGLDERIAALAEREAKITADLAALAEQGVDGITFPGDA